MKIKNKKYIFFTIILLGIIFNVNINVKADEDLSYTTLCTYRNTIDEGANLVEIRYYNNTGDFHVLAKKESKVPNPQFENAFGLYSEVGKNNLPTKNIFWNDTAIGLSLRGNGCPKYAYVDEAGSKNELCFSNNPDDCIAANPGGLGTKFKGESELIVETVDNYLESLKNASSAINSYTCSDNIYNVDVFKDVYNRYWDDIKIGNATTVPDLVLNSQDYKTIADGYNKNYQTKVDECYEQDKKALKDKLDSGEIKKQEYEKLLKELDSKKQNIKQNVSNVLNNKPIENVDSSTTTYFECGILPVEIVEKLNWYLNLIKYGGVVLAIGLGMLDLAKSILSDEGDANKKAIQKMTKRLIAAAVIFIIPLIIQFILSTVEIGGVDPKNPLCIKRTK